MKDTDKNEMDMICAFVRPEILMLLRRVEGVAHKSVIEKAHAIQGLIRRKCIEGAS